MVSFNDFFDNVYFSSSRLSEDNAGYPFETKECEFKEDDPYYSDQGFAFTCVRHALAKAIYREISGWTKNRINIKVENLVTALLNCRRDRGGRGAYVDDWNNKTLACQGKRGHVYDITLKIETTSKLDASHIVCIDLREYLDFFKNHKERQGHAMFCEFQDPKKKEVILRNSWGSKDKYINVKFNASNVTAYYVHVKDLVWRGVDSERPDKYIFLNFQHDLLRNDEYPKED